MKIEVDRAKFAEAFFAAAYVAPSRSPKEILQNVKLTASEGSVTLEATDMEIAIRSKVDGSVDVMQSGSVLLPSSRTASILRESSDETITIESTEIALMIRGKASKFRLPVANVDEFPSMSTQGEGDHITVSAKAIKAAIQRTVYATDGDSSRYALGGIKLESEGNKGIAVGTDGRRLCKAEFPVERDGELLPLSEVGSIVIPTMAAKLIDKGLDPKDESVRIYPRLNDIIVESSRCSVYARLIEGRYPQWRQVVKQTGNDPESVSMPAGILHACIRQAAITTSQESAGVNITFGNGSLVVESETADLGQSRIEVPLAYDGDPVTVKLNHKYIGEFCQTVPADSAVEIRFKAGTTPVELSVGDEYLQVIMPMARE